MIWLIALIYRALGFLERELLDILDSYYAVPIKRMNIGQLLTGITELLRRYRLSLPPELVIRIKALVTAEGTARLIYLDLDIVTEKPGTIFSTWP